MTNLKQLAAHLRALAEAAELPSLGTITASSYPCTNSGPLHCVDYGPADDPSDRFDLYEDPPAPVCELTAFLLTNVEALLGAVEAVERVRELSERWEAYTADRNDDRSRLSMAGQDVRTTVVRSAELREALAALEGETAGEVGTE